MEKNILIDTLKKKSKGITPDILNNISNYCTKLTNQSLPIILDVEHLRRLIGVPKNNFYKIVFSPKYQYNRQSIFKKNNIEKRQLLIPSENLKKIQRWILDNILYKKNCLGVVHGFIPNRSITTNAELHVGKSYILKLDIKDFFPSITQKKVYKLFHSLGYTKKISSVLSIICTYNGSYYKTPVLPQGAPTSPYISNLVCHSMDLSILKLCEENGIDYSRYADDMTFSGDVIQDNIIKRIIAIVNYNGFEIKNEKTKKICKQKKQTVTGITVNQKLNPNKLLQKELRQHIHYIEKYGIYDHLKYTQKEHLTNYKNYLYGIASYIMMVDRKKGEYYFSKLSEIDFTY